MTDIYGTDPAGPLTWADEENAIAELSWATTCAVLGVEETDSRSDTRIETAIYVDRQNARDIIRWLQQHFPGVDREID